MNGKPGNVKGAVCARQRYDDKKDKVEALTSRLFEDPPSDEGKDDAQSSTGTGAVTLPRRQPMLFLISSSTPVQYTLTRVFPRCTDARRNLRPDILLVPADEYPAGIHCAAKKLSSGFRCRVLGLQNEVLSEKVTCAPLRRAVCHTTWFCID